MYIDTDELRRAEREDQTWFDARPDREYRLRRAWPAELAFHFHDDVKPAGFEVFVILHRQDVERRHAHTLFANLITFDTDRGDPRVREMLLALATNPLAVKAKP